MALSPEVNAWMKSERSFHRMGCSCRPIVFVGSSWALWLLNETWLPMRAPYRSVQALQFLYGFRSWYATSSAGSRKGPVMKYVVQKSEVENGDAQDQSMALPGQGRAATARRFPARA